MTGGILVFAVITLIRNIDKNARMVYIGIQKYRKELDNG
jgi:hypothetical protein